MAAATPTPLHYSGSALVVRAGVLSRAFRIFRRGGPRSVFIGEFEETIVQIRVGGIAGETAATLGLLAKVKGLCHRAHSHQGGSPLGGSQSPAPVVIAGNVRIVSSLGPVSDSFSPFRTGGRGLGLVPARAIFQGSLHVFGVAT